MKKTHKNLAEIELENLINKMVDKMIIEYCQHKNLVHFIDNTFLAEQTQTRHCSVRKVVFL